MAAEKFHSQMKIGIARYVRDGNGMPSIISSSCGVRNLFQNNICHAHAKAKPVRMWHWQSVNGQWIDWALLCGSGSGGGK